MASRKDDASVATFADHEVITPPHDLRKAIAPAAGADDDPVARAEAALAGMAAQFVVWMRAECVRLDGARRQVRQLGFTKQTRDELFRASHDIKGEAATFGFPEAGHAAESLCRLIEHTPDIAQIPLTLVDQHVDAVGAITRERARADFEPLATALTLGLRELTDDFLRLVNAERPDYLDIIFAPPLAPGSAES